MRTLTTGLALSVAMALSMTGFSQSGKSASEAEVFVAQAEKELAAHSVLAGRAEWINATYITEDTDALAAEFGARGTELSVRLAKEASKFNDVKDLPSDLKRKLEFLKQRIVLPAPDKPGAAEELSTIATELQSAYGKGKGTLNGQPISGSDIEDAMRTVRDPDKLKEMWVSWHNNVGAPMHDDYARLVSIANQGDDPGQPEPSGRGPTAQLQRNGG